MSNYSSLKSAIDANIKANGRREITGPVLNAILNAVVNSLGDGYLFRGVAIPSTNPGTPDQNVAYLAITEGTYTHMGGLSVTDGELSVFSYKGAWSKIPLALVPTKTSQLDNDLRFVTPEEMGESLSSKQDTIQDLSEIRSGAALANNSDHRPYNSSNPDGMGYLVLKKNKTFAEQVTEANTIYEIRYDFDLNGASVTIPAGCVLIFNGGKLTNGTIIGQDTKINAEIVKIFSTNTIISGSWDVPFSFPEWFGAVGDSIEDDREAIQKTIDSFDVIKLTRKYAILSSVNGIGISVGSHKRILGNKRIDYTASVTLVFSSSLIEKAIVASSGVIIKNVSINGNYLTSVGGGNDYGIDCNGTRISLENVFVNQFHIGIGSSICYLSTFANVQVNRCDYGFYFSNVTGKNTSLSFVNCYANACRYNGFYLKNYIYSNLISCAADNIGVVWDGLQNTYDTQSFSGINTNAAYTFYSCLQTNLIGCGCEASLRAFYAFGSNMSVSLFANPLSDSTIMTADIFKYYIILHATIGKYNYWIDTTLTGPYLYTYEYSSTATQVFTTNVPQSRTTYQYTTNRNSLVTEISHMRVCPSVKPNDVEAELGGFRKILPICETLPYSIKYKISTGQNYNFTATESPVVDTIGNHILEFYADSLAINQGIKFNTSGTVLFKGFKKIVFRNIHIKSKFSTSDNIISFEDTDVVFENCVFSFENRSATKLFFKAERANVMFINCVFLYNYYPNFINIPVDSAVSYDTSFSNDERFIPGTVVSIPSIPGATFVSDESYFSFVGYVDGINFYTTIQSYTYKGRVRANIIRNGVPIWWDGTKWIDSTGASA